MVLIQDKKMNIKSEMADTNANFNLTAFIDMAGKYPAVKADLNLKQVDLQKLNFSATELRMAGLVKADIKTADPNYLNGDVSIRGMQLVKDGQRFNVDTIDVHAEATAKHTLLTLKSELLSARVDGQYQLTNLAPAIINQINKYYAFGEVTKIPDQRFRFNMNIYNPKFIKKLYPCTNHLLSFQNQWFTGYEKRQFSHECLGPTSSLWRLPGGQYTSYGRQF